VGVRARQPTEASATAIEAPTNQRTEIEIPNRAAEIEISTASAGEVARDARFDGAQGVFGDVRVGERQLAALAA
jgi:hypothetical protein